MISDHVADSASDLVVEPWRPRNARPESSMTIASLVCAFRMPRAVFDENIALYFSRDEGADRLWALLEIEEELHDILNLTSMMTISRLLTLCEASDVDMWCAVQGPSAGTPRTSSLTMAEALLRAWSGVGKYASPLREGLLTWADIRRIVAPIERAAARRALEGKLFRGAPIVKLAAGLGLSPSHSGGSPWAWLCRCPGTSHHLMINAQSGDWGCGYCRRKGRAEELVEFASGRKRDGRVSRPTLALNREE